MTGDGPPVRRSASALARCASQLFHRSLTVAGPTSCSTHPDWDLAQMVVAGSPAPVGVKRDRPPVVVSSPSPVPALLVRVAAGNTHVQQQGEDVAPFSPASSLVVPPVAPGSPNVATKKRRHSHRSGLSSMAASADTIAQLADEHRAAGSGVHAVSVLSSRGRSREERPPPTATTTAHRTAVPSIATERLPAQPKRSLSMTLSARGAVQERSKSLSAVGNHTVRPLASNGAGGCTSPSNKLAGNSRNATPQAQSGTSAAPPMRRGTTTALVDSAPDTLNKTAQPQTIRKYAVQANAYHSTFVQTMMMSRGPEWKHTHRCTERLTAADIAQCEFVWFKYEFIKSMPHCERVRVPRSVVPYLNARTADVRALWEAGASAWPDRSVAPYLRALDLLNAYVMPEAPEVPSPSSPLTNIFRTRLPSMLLCQNSLAHVVGPLPPGTPDDVQAAFMELRPLLHYHFMKYVKGTPIVGCFKEASAVWRKHLLYRYTKQFCDNDPSTRGSVRERMPASYEYDLNNPDAADGARVFMVTLMEKAGVVRWLAKATGGANGNGFYVTKDPEDMIRYVDGQPRKGCGDADFWVIQEFVERMPLLFGGHRFHMKVHVVMIGTPVGIDVYAYKRQRIQCCSEVFDPDVMTPLSYIGNWGQQRFATNLVQEKFSTLLEDIKGEYPKLLPAFHRAKQVIAESIEAAWRCGRQHFAFEPGCYELMGWDFVMEECSDGEWRPLLVEANHRPGFGSERKYMEKLIHEVLELVMYPINGLTKYVKETHNGVVENIWDHVKTIVIDPLDTGAAADASTQPNAAA